jgi:hypothetical protein
MSEGSPSDAGLHVPQRMPGHRSMDAKRLRGLDPMGVIGFVKEDMDGGPPVALKNGGAPQ